jgi:hypothetical protein
MSKEERQALIDEANALALDFPGNISTEKLRAMVEECQGPAIKEEDPEELDTVSDERPAAPAPAPAPAPALDLSNPKVARRKAINDAKKKAFEKRVVTITNKDNRENEFMTTVTLGFENQHFGLSKVVPLDIPVELEQALIDLAESTMMTLHKDEIVDGKRTGNKRAVTVKKFAISYARD